MAKGKFYISLRNPIDNFIETNRAPIGCREHFVVQSRPLFRQWITTKEATLDAREMNLASDTVCIGILMTDELLK